MNTNQIIKQAQEEFKTLVLDIFLKHKTKGYPLGQLEKRGGDFISQAITQAMEKERERVLSLAEGITYNGANGVLVDVRKDLEDYERFLQNLDEDKLTK